MKNNEIIAIHVTQWLSDWDNVRFNENRRKPAPNFLMFSINANTLKRLSKVYPRKKDDKRNIEIGVQRKHDPERSEKIRNYVFGGFPWSDLSDSKRNSSEFADLKMPGWLPTAIIANILAPGTIRGGQKIKNEDLITLASEEKNITKLILPKNALNADWVPSVPPLEIIDGQHRLWAFNQDEHLNGDFDLPVVAFYDLDISWQAYLFYTINIKPKKINASLAFDLYPILRLQDWLERSPEGVAVYKETRAQELIEVLWSYGDSPWKERINMLGEKYERGKDNVLPTITQAAFIRNLISTFIKTTSTKNLGGLFGALLRDKSILYWNRTQQAAFLIFVWKLMVDAIEKCKEPWATTLRDFINSEKGNLYKEEINNLDPAYASRLSLIATDQGVRGYLHIINDMVFMLTKDFNLNQIEFDDNVNEERIDPIDVKKSIAILNKTKKLKEYIVDITEDLMRFDWRTSSFELLSEQERKKQMVFKGSSGYKEIRNELLKVLSTSKNELVSNNAKNIMKELGYAN